MKSCNRWFVHGFGRFAALFCVWCAGWATQAARAQIVIWLPPEPPHIPRPPHLPPQPPDWPAPTPPQPPASPVELRSVNVDADLKGQAARVRLHQTFFNPTDSPVESQYIFPLPEDGAVQDFVLIVDGKEMPGRVLDASEARRIYEEIVRRRRDPALMECIGRGMFKTSVFPVPARKEVEVTLSYSQFCKKDGGAVEFGFPFSTQSADAKSIGHIEIAVNVDSEQPIQSVYSPTHDVKVERKGDKRAAARWEERDVSRPRDFKLYVSASDAEVGMSLLSYWPGGRGGGEPEDGYFVLLASPKIQTDANKKPVPKTVIMVLDRSGSMQGKKIQQARDALKFVVNNLSEGDTFNIIAYDDRVDSFAPELQAYSKDKRKEALDYIDNIRAGGSTNIDEALARAMAMIPEDTRPCYVLFMTDGLPTAGETDELKIARHIKDANKRTARVFVFGVGYDANARLLDRLSTDNRGTSVYVKPDEDLERAVGGFYGKMSSPVLTDLKIDLDGARVNRAYPQDLPDLFEGGQLVWVGRYDKPGALKAMLSGKAGERGQSFALDARLADKGEGQSNDFIETLWATRRVSDLLNEIDLHGRNEELITELVTLSKRYGILTPYTSFLADESTPVSGAIVSGDVVRAAASNLSALDSVSGEAGQAQRMYKAQLKDSAAPAAAMARSRGGGVYAYDAAGEKREANNVRQFGTKTFYQRGGVWMDGELDEAKLKDVKTIKLYSDEYFALAEKLAPRDRQYLVFSEAATVLLNGEAYRFEP